jgi:hypothetical protein
MQSKEMFASPGRAGMALLAVPVPVAANEVLDWNPIALDVGVASGQHPTQGGLHRPGIVWLREWKKV